MNDVLHPDAKITWTDEGLKSLYAMITNDLMAGAIYAYPNATDFNNRGLYEGCVELERRGLLTRRESTPEITLFISREREGNRI